MNTIKISIITVLTGILAITTSCSSKTEVIENNQPTETKQSLPVKTSIVKSESIAKTIDFTASLIPFKEVHLAPSTPGRIEKIMLKLVIMLKRDK